LPKIRITSGYLPYEILILERIYVCKTISTLHDNLNFIGKFEKNESNCIFTNVQIISTLAFIEYEDKEKGILRHYEIRGGDIIQFVNVVSRYAALAKSIFQYLVGFENCSLTQFPWYEEANIIFPEGNLGLIMTTRFSPKKGSKI